jgi:hypothetical protein
MYTTVHATAASSTTLMLPVFDRLLLPIAVLTFNVLLLYVKLSTATTRYHVSSNVESVQPSSTSTSTSTPSSALGMLILRC